MSEKVLVIGSSNTDMVVKTAEFPKAGETVLGGAFLMNPGGKGANQAVAAARLGAHVRFVAKVGTDVFGQKAEAGFVNEGLDIGFLMRDKDFPSGVALIIVNERGENQIVVASGANMQLLPKDLPDDIFADISYVLLQLEIPLETVKYVIDKCKDLKIKIILNPAPAIRLEDEFLKGIYLITPNETETKVITGILPEDEKSMAQAADFFLGKGIENVVITLGKKGVFLKNAQHSRYIPALKVRAVDSTAAGDVFNGAILTALSQSNGLIQACEFACKAAAISVTRLGAQSSAPFKHEIN